MNALETEISQLRQEMSAINAAKSEAESSAAQLRHELEALTTAKTEAETELNTAKLKNGKLLVKVKTLTKQVGYKYIYMIQSLFSMCNSNATIKYIFIKWQQIDKYKRYKNILP